MPFTLKEIWGDERFADATVTMGKRIWRVHRCIVCPQSCYFMKAYEGKFKESQTKTVDLSNGEFSEQAIDMMLRFLYTHELERSQKNDSLGTVIVADYFQIKSLRTMALEELKASLVHLISGAQIYNYKKLALKILREHSDTDIEQVLVTATSNNLPTIIHNYFSPSTWEEITQQHPFFANKVIQVMVPKPEAAGSAGHKRSAGIAFDDLYHSRSNARARGSY